MDNWLKGLVAAACVVVIAGGAYTLWEKKQQEAASAEAAANSALRTSCLETLKRANSADTERRHWCFQNGHISQREYNDQRAGKYID